MQNKSERDYIHYINSRTFNISILLHYDAFLIWPAEIVERLIQQSVL